MSFFKNLVVEVAGGVGSALGTAAGVVVGAVVGIGAGAIVGYKLGESAGESWADSKFASDEPAAIDITPEVIVEEPAPTKRSRSRKAAATAA